MPPSSVLRALRGRGPPLRTTVGRCRSSCGPHALRKLGHANTVQAGHELGRKRIRPLAVELLFLYFLNIFKSLQI
jgi:hypothetical protein